MNNWKDLMRPSESYSGLGYRFKFNSLNFEEILKRANVEADAPMIVKLAAQCEQTADGRSDATHFLLWATGAPEPIIKRIATLNPEHILWLWRTKQWPSIEDFETGNFM